ncbi:MAG: DUF1638 domain-containing protein [Gammaproteobacteria bacterium]|nr:DUF1638 domain-containing protein [Gammaproteobacteria bacterium]MBU1777713.1 DUF1638 domain-containing protein [Gammaproteobacteria bacterium]MBU1969266.1 DUF1638 domain-containing protein [Gammaproteobacteria bacterium]
MSGTNCMLLGCGILRKEVEYLIRKNGWSLDTDWLDSALHIDLEALAAALQSGIQRNRGREVVVLYGCCHPRMDDMLTDAQLIRTQGQNCVEILLGHETFMRELEAGTFFLLEDWALRWDEVIGKTFGGKPEVVKEIFALTSTSLLCLRTPCSGDYTQAANAAGEKVGLPVRWMDVGLEHLEAVLKQAMQQARTGTTR